MSDWIISIEGTQAGLYASAALAILAAFLHAVLGAIQKRRFDPWVSRSAIDACYGVFGALLAFFVVPWPEPHMWPIFAGMMVIHAAYKYFQAMAFSRGAYTVVYPVLRGTGPLFTVFGAWIVFGEVFNAAQWGGVAVLLAGIFGLAVYNLRHIKVDRNTLVPALWLAVVAGGFAALYTTYDAYGIRATADPFTFIAWFFFLDAFFMPIWNRRRLMAVPRADWGPLARQGLIGALVAMASFGSIMLATRLGPVGQAAVLRETSTVFAALVGWLMLGERVGPRRLILMVLIAAGAVIVHVAA
jgi:drug/metabolite transporter (DMT)-like permease